MDALLYVFYLASISNKQVLIEYFTGMIGSSILVSETASPSVQSAAITAL